MSVDDEAIPLETADGLPPALDITSSLSGARQILVFGGPYSNLGATLALRARAEALGIPPDHTICTGDVIAYCAEPEATARAIREWGCHVVAGNCEQQIAAAANDCGCGFEEGTACDLLAKGWYPFANQRVSGETRDWMSRLPAAITFETGRLRFRVVHGGVQDISKFIFGSQAAAIATEFCASGADIVIAGHAGLPFMHRLARNRGVWFNPGVVGMPANDGTTDVWYGLLSLRPDGGVRLSAARLAYDHHAAAAAMRRHAYADPYARSLVTGVWPSFDVLPPPEKERTGRRISLRPMDVSAGRASAG